MSCFRCGDPLDDFDRLDREQAKWLESLPVCERCGKPIQDEHLYLSMMNLSVRLVWTEILRKGLMTIAIKNWRD